MKWGLFDLKNEEEYTFWLGYQLKIREEERRWKRI